MQAQLSKIENTETSTQVEQLVTMRVDNQLLAIPVQHVRDVLKEGKITFVPLAPGEVSGSMNLRGRIVTVLDMRHRLKLPAVQQGVAPMFVVVEHKCEFYSLKVDSIGDVLSIAFNTIEKSPPNLSANWREISIGVHRLPDELMVIVDIKELLALSHKQEEK